LAKLCDVKVNKNTIRTARAGVGHTDK